MLEKYINKIREHSRIKKLNQLLAYLDPVSTDKFLEVGVANIEHSPVDNFLIHNYPYKEKITALGVGDLSGFRRNYPGIYAISYNGREFPFADLEFDIAHANAVIEHVGNLDAQEVFLREMVRVARRGMITTPNRHFPIELHTRVLFLHLTRKRWFDRFLGRIGKGWATGEYMNLLTLRDIRNLVSKVGLSKYHIIGNRWGGAIMTFSIIWNSSCDAPSSEKIK